MGSRLLLQQDSTSNVHRSKGQIRHRSTHTLTTRRVAQARLGIALGRAYLAPQGRGKLHTITEEQYEYLTTLTNLARADGGFTHALYWHTIRKRSPSQIRRLVRMHDLGRGPKETLLA